MALNKRQRTKHRFLLHPNQWLTHDRKFRRTIDTRKKRIYPDHAGTKETPNISDALSQSTTENGSNKQKIFMSLSTKLVLTGSRRRKLSIAVVFSHCTIENSVDSKAPVSDLKQIEIRVKKRYQPKQHRSTSPPRSASRCQADIKRNYSPSLTGCLIVELSKLENGPT